MFHDPQGSLWRRWDFHVHTPSSVPSQFGKSWRDDTWEAWAVAMLGAVRFHRVRAIALADYFTVSGYQELVERGIYDPSRHVLVADGEEEPLFILPGLELRLSHITHDNHAINVHVIFDPSRLTVDRIRADFLDKLHLDPRQGNQELVATENHILALGRANQTGRPLDLNEGFRTLSHEERQGLLKKGHEKAAVALEHLKERLQALDVTVSGGRSYLLAVAKTGHGSLGELPWEGQAANIKHNLLRAADLLFSSSSDDRDFLLGNKAGTSEDQITTWFGATKACVWGSDSHSLDNLLHPSNGATRRYCWIKADLSFEGLKQVLYEPGDRAIVQEEDPDQRPWTEIISRVRFRPPTATDLAPDGWIPLNPRLTTIIGGKSSGKSLLLYLIAKTIDPTQTRQRLRDEDLPYGELEASLGFEVEWKNGDVQSLGGAEASPARITYLPQNYINRLAEPESKSELEKVILRLLREDSGFSAVEADMRASIDATAKQLSSQAARLFDLRRQIDEIAELIQDLGNEEAIAAEIERLEEEMDGIRAAADMSDTESERFRSLRAKRSAIDTAIQAGEVRLRLIDDFRRDVQGLARTVRTDIADIRPAQLGDTEASVPEDPLVRAIATLRAEVDTAFEGALSAISQDRLRVEEDIAAQRQEAEAVDAQLAPFEEKLDSRERAASLEEAQKRQREALTAIRENKKRLDAANEKLHDVRESTLRTYRSLYDAYAGFVEEHLGPEMREIASDVELICEVRFSESSFATQIGEGLDGRQRLEGKLEAFGQGSNEYGFRSIDDHVDTVRSLLVDFTGPDESRAMKLKRNYDPSVMASLLLKNHFGLHLSLKHGGDELPEMSPGKRGMVLLRLLLERSGASHPILIDQPEDNLDNRTVFSDLRAAVKNRKRDRQILMVTHNANLVVATDAEAVLVAHQYGPGEQPDQGTRFEYRGGSLEHAYPRSDHSSVLESQGTKEHTCEILEGGEEAFVSRQRKYEFQGR